MSALDNALKIYDDNVMKIYLVRHGQTDWNLNGLRQGRQDIELNEFGRKQAKELRDKLADTHFDLCISSPLKRAAETAQIICGDRREIRYDDRLVERCFGKTEGQPSNITPMEYDWVFGAKFEDETFETLEQLFARAKSFIDDLKTIKADSVLVVCHGSLAKAIHYNIVGYNKNTNFLDWFLENCSYDCYDLLN